MQYLPMFSRRIFSTFFMNSIAISRFSLFWMARRGLALCLGGGGGKEGGTEVGEVQEGETICSG